MSSLLLISTLRKEDLLLSLEIYVSSSMGARCCCWKSCLLAVGVVVGERGFGRASCGREAAAAEDSSLT
ncbi:uncharacterized protein A4U43_C04F15000 [Asparagus officinalis]|uniref:Uncharacterized protein n=1 Tax=Asparagus officinalis TaxID=4686 RepID=A0A5P1F1K5_ASPOF|nr:uncharacterized protein A4U43_C04F15000 [Asparagus officinalis]